jgi:uncharacterized repeat protein (TIGR01451 family)
MALGVVSFPSAYADPNVDASKDDALTNDVDGDTVADPGDTIRYTITITNNGNMDAAAVSYSDTIDGNSTLVGGSLKTTPLALDDAYNAVGNVSISVPAPGVLGNDTDPDGGVVTAIAIVGGSSSNGGDVDLAADGSFTYDPPPGFEGNDTFNYEIQDTDSNTDTGTVTISVSGMIWFVDSSATCPCDGRLSDPFDDLAVTVDSFDVNATDSAGDSIFVYEGSYNGGLTLLNNQKLIGDGSSSDLATVSGLSLPPESTPLPAFSGTKPDVTGTADGVGVGQNNTIRGLDIASGTGTGIRGSNVATLTVSETDLSGGGAIDINTGNLAVALDSLSASSSTDEGIRLAGVTGTFNIVDTTGTISTTNVAAVDITGTGGGISLGVTLTSVSSTGSSTNGINLDTTTGSFTVTGTGPAGSGGTIDDILGGSDGATAGIGVRLNNVTNVSLSSMQLNDFSNFAIRGTNVTNFDLTDSTINGVNGTSAGFDEGSVSFTNLLGSANFTDNTISGGLEDNLHVVNTSGTLDRMTVSGGTIGLNSTALGNDGILAESQGSATLNVTVEDVLFLGSRGDLLQTNTIGSSTMDIVILDNTFQNAHTNIVSGGGGITLSGGSGGGNITVTYDVFGTNFGDQTFRDALGNAITINYLNGAGTAFGTVENNRIGVSGVVGSGSDASSGILIGSGGTVNHRVLVNNNEILGIDGFAGLDVVANAHSTLDATITNNTIREMTGFVLAGMYYLVGGGAGDTSTLCADIRGNTVDAGGVSFASAVFFDQISGSANHNLPGYAGSPHGEFGSPSTGTASVDIESYLNGLGNWLTAGASAFFVVDASLVQGVTGNAGCSLPLRAALGEGPHGLDVEILANEQLSATVSRAIDLWPASGRSRSEMSRLQRATFDVVDLPDGPLGIHPVSPPNALPVPVSALLMGAVLGATPDEEGASIIESGETVNLTIGTLPPGKSITITFEVTVDSPLPAGTTQICNQGIVSGSNFVDELTDDPDVGGVADPTCTDVDVPTADLSISKDDGQSIATPGASVTYTIVVSNNGPDDATGASVNDTFPSALSGCTWTCTASAGSSCTVAGSGNISDTVDLLVGGMATYTATCDIDAGAAGTLANTATVTAPADRLDPTPGNDSQTDIDTLAPEADLSITKSDSPDPVVAGDPLGYTITVNNAGPSDATNVVVTDTLPAGVTFVSTAGCAEDPNGVPTCTLGNIPAGGSALYTISVTVDLATVGVIANSASVSSGTSDPNPGNDSALEDTTVLPPNQPPTAICVQLSAEADATCCVDVDVSDIDGGSSDPDGAGDIVSLCFTELDGGSLPCVQSVQICDDGTFASHSISLTITDTFGESDSCSTTVTLFDGELPSIACPSDIIADNDPGQCDALVTYTAPVGTDNCAGASTSQTAGLGSGAFFPVGVTTETFEVTDGSGNTAQCSFTITVNDIDRPAVDCLPVRHHRRQRPRAMRRAGHIYRSGWY